MLSNIKYCKNLKSIKDLDEESYQKIIRQWKRRDKEAYKLISSYKGLLSMLLDTDKGFNFNFLNVFAFSSQLESVNKFLNNKQKLDKKVR